MLNDCNLFYQLHQWGFQRKRFIYPALPAQILGVIFFLTNVFHTNISSPPWNLLREISLWLKMGTVCGWSCTRLIRAPSLPPSRCASMVKLHFSTPIAKTEMRDDFQNAREAVCYVKVQEGSTPCECSRLLPLSSKCWAAGGHWLHRCHQAGGLCKRCESLSFGFWYQSRLPTLTGKLTVWHAAI